MGTTTAANLNPVVTYMNNGGAVYVQSEVGCCNNEAAFADAIINATVTVGGSITHSTVFTGYYQTIPPPSILCTPWETYGAWLRPYVGTPAANIFLDANAFCGGAITTGDVVGVKFCSTDMISGQGAFISIGDFNVFPQSGTCTATGILGTPNDNNVIDLIANLFDSLLICAPFNTSGTATVNPVTNITVCAGDNILPSTFVSTPGGAAFTWTNSNTAIGLGAGGAGNTPGFIATNSSGLPIIATITVNASLGCPGPPTTYTITVNPTPTVTVSNINYCNGDTIPATPFTSVPAGATFTWTNSNPAIGVPASGTGGLPSFIASNTTNSPITATITVIPTGSGCVGLPTTYTITINPTPSVTVPTNATYCPGDNIPTATFTTNPTGATTTWTNSNTAIGLGASGNGNIPSFVATNTTNNPITATITVTPTINGCAGVPVTYTITVSPGLSATANGNMQICLGDPLTLTATGSGNGTITWYSDPGGTNVIGTGSPFTPPLVTSTGTYVFYVNEDGSCPSALDSIVVTINGVDAVINASPLTGQSPLNVFFGNGSTNGPGITYYWNFGTGGDTSIVFEPSYTYSTNGSYTVMLIVTDGFCSDTAWITIEVFDESALFIPNVFTPNGDNHNDFFSVGKTNIVSIKCQIFNRWGLKMHSWENLDGFWDGRAPSGDFATDGTYFYIIEAVGGDDVEYIKKGSFSLIR